MTSCARLLCLPGAALIAVFSGMFTTVAAQQNAAANYPTKPIRWITPYPPGGSTTALSRMVGDKLSRSEEHTSNSSHSQQSRMPSSA